MTATWLSLLATKNLIDLFGITRRNLLNEPVNRSPVHGNFFGKKWQIDRSARAFASLANGQNVDQAAWADFRK
jgi:hypothetical protein